VASVYRSMVEAIRRNNADLTAADLKKLCRASCPAPQGTQEAKAWHRAIAESFKPQGKAPGRIEPAEPERCPRTIDMFEATHE
jgi:hypothetical protein